MKTKIMKTKIMKTKIMKTRVKKKNYKLLSNTDLIGIKWKSGEKGILLKTKEGIVSLNKDEMAIRKCFAALTKSEYLGRDEVKRDHKKVFLFENMRALLKWFAKK